MIFYEMPVYALAHITRATGGFYSTRWYHTKGKPRRRRSRKRFL